MIRGMTTIMTPTKMVTLTVIITVKVIVTNNKDIPSITTGAPKRSSWEVISINLQNKR